MQTPQVFVSFSTNDSLGVRRLIARLGAQPLDIWDYSMEGQEIPFGVDVNDYLERKIAGCNVFVPVLSAFSFASKYTKLEVECAVSRYREGSLTILPLLARDCEMASNWPHPYDQLAGMRFYRIDFFSRQVLEEVIMIMCERLGITYRPLLMSDDKLPFTDKLASELRTKCPQNVERNIGVYRRLMQILNDFQGAYVSGDFRAALDKTSYLVLTLESEFGKESFYYSYIVQAVCQISCGFLVQAIETINKTWDSPLLDENAFAAMGYIRYQEGKYHEALDFYRAASNYDKQDPAAKSWVVKTSLLLGVPVEVDGLFDAATEARIASAKDKLAFSVLKAQALASSARFDEAEALYRGITERGVHDPNILVNYAHVLIEIERGREALDMLEHHRASIENENPNYSHLVASLYYLLGRPETAADRFEHLVERWPHNRQYRLDAGQVLCRIGRTERAREITEPMVRGTGFPLPATEHDFYCDGYANWLRGEFALAEYDFRRSNEPIENHYARLSGDRVLFNIEE